MTATGERSPEASARKGRPRDARIDGDITAAALDVLAEGGFEGFSVEAVAVRAGVARTTVYRRFPTRDELLVGALERLNDTLPPAPPPGPVRERLVQVLGEVCNRTPRSVRGKILMHAAAEGTREPGLADLVQSRVLTPRRTILRNIIREGIATGELRDDIDLDAVIPVLVGPMLYLGMWSMTAAVRDVSVESVVDTVLSGLTRANGS
jgi:AcrR family transcriptional regulator